MKVKPTGAYVTTLVRGLRTKNQIYHSKQVDYKLSCLAGTIATVDVEKFHRLLFRTSKGNIWFNAEGINSDDVVITTS